MVCLQARGIGVMRLDRSEFLDPSGEICTGRQVLGGIAAQSEDRNLRSDSCGPSLSLSAAIQPLRGITRIFLFTRNINVFVD